MDLSKRTVQHGSHPMPAELMSLVSRVQSVSLLRDFEPNEANAIDYCKSKGHWLKPHVDDRCAAMQLLLQCQSWLPQWRSALHDFA